MKVRFIGTVEVHDKTSGFREFRLTKSERERFIEYVKSLPEGFYEINIRKLAKRRSDKQRRYFHGVICEQLRQHLGYFTVDEVKDEVIGPKFLMLEFEWGEDMDPGTGEVKEQVTYKKNPYFDAEPAFLARAKEVFIDHNRLVRYPTELLTTKEQEQLNEAVRSWAAIEYGLNIEPPRHFTDDDVF